MGSGGTCHYCGKYRCECDVEETVRVAIDLSAESYEAFDRLRKRCGHKNIAQTIKAALRLYGVDEDIQGRLVVSQNK